jgi:hypothetical protein
MEFFLPSVLLVLFAFFVSTQFLPKFSMIILGSLSLLLLAFTVYNHYSFFKNEYRIMTWADTAKNFAPTLLVSLVIVMMIGYLLFSAGIKPTNIDMPFNAGPSMNRGRNANIPVAPPPPADGPEPMQYNNSGYNESALNRGV